MQALDQICGAIGAVTGAVDKVLDLFQTKVLQLRRLATILEKAGASIQLPDVTSLVRIVDIDQQVYAQLRAACPVLKLPEYSNESVEKLRATVLGAYNAVAAILNGHPWSQLGNLQSKLDEYLALAEDEINKATSGATGVLQCISNVCSGQLGASLSGSLDQLEEAGNTLVKLPESTTQALTATQKGLTSLVGETKNGLNTLITEWTVTQQ